MTEGPAVADPSPGPRVGLKLEIDAVSKTFARPGARGLVVPAVVQATLCAQPGEVHVIVGPSGCGKSTLLSLAAGLARPTTGRVRWDGQVASPAAAFGARGQRVGCAFQETPFVAELTARENLLLPGTFVPLPGAAARADLLLERLGLVDRAHFRPDALSGGERRRLCLARALIGKPELIILDEPTADLDHEWTGKVIKLLLGRAKMLGATLLVASHEPLLLEGATHRHAMAAGVLAPVR